MSNPPQKPRPRPDLQFVFHPEQDTAYVHFEHAADNPFDSNATRLGRRNAWWLADAALLAYWDSPEALRRFNTAGLQAELIDVDGVQAYVASSAASVIVAFRGTEPDEWSDVFDDALFKQEPWEHGPGHMHKGFKAALERIWPKVRPRLDELGSSRSVWMSGHSLGAALATLAAARFRNTKGVVTLGSPRVGDVTFVADFDQRFSGRSLRYVSDTDIVTHVPPPIHTPFRYDHIGSLRQISGEGEVIASRPRLDHFFRELFGDVGHLNEVVQGLQSGGLKRPPKFLLDHMPRGYAVDIWNDYARRGD